MVVHDLHAVSTFSNRVLLIQNIADHLINNEGYHSGQRRSEHCGKSRRAIRPWAFHKPTPAEADIPHKPMNQTFLLKIKQWLPIERQRTKHTPAAALRSAIHKKGRRAAAIIDRAISVAPSRVSRSSSNCPQAARCRRSAQAHQAHKPAQTIRESESLIGKNQYDPLPKKQPAIECALS